MNQMYLKGHIQQSKKRKEKPNTVDKVMTTISHNRYIFLISVEVPAPDIPILMDPDSVLSQSINAVGIVIITLPEKDIKITPPAMRWENQKEKTNGKQTANHHIHIHIQTAMTTSPL